MEKSNNFDDFKRYFKEYQREYGLNGYQVYFKHMILEDSFADIEVNQSAMVATVRFNKKLPPKDKEFNDVKKTAQHEVLHLLIHKLENLARCRYIDGSEIYEACEELVNKLRYIINNGGE